RPTSNLRPRYSRSRRRDPPGQCSCRPVELEHIVSRGIGLELVPGAVELLQLLDAVNAMFADEAGHHTPRALGAHADHPGHDPPHLFEDTVDKTRFELLAFDDLDVLVAGQIDDASIPLLAQSRLDGFGDPTPPKPVQVFTTRRGELDTHFEPIRLHQIERPQ